MCRTTFNLNIYCRKSKADKNGVAPLELSININQKRCFINLPYKAKPEDFNRKRRPAELQEYVNITMGNINHILNDMARYGVPVTAENLRSYLRTGGFKPYSIEDLFTEYLKLVEDRVGVDITQSSYVKYTKVCELFYDFMDKKQEVTAITPAVIQKFYVHLQKKYNSSTSASYISKIKTVIMFGMDNGKLKINPFQGLKVHRDRKPIDYLTEDEISALKQAKIDNKSLCAVRDAFLLQVYSGLSYIDLEHLKKEDIKITDDGTHYIRKPRVKTGVEYTAIILPDGIDILKRNYYQLKVISNQKMNLYLKTVMTLAGIEHNLTTHLGRKTYGHILLNSGVRLEVVAKNLGHSSSKTTAKFYAELTTDTVLQEVKSVI